MISQPIEGRLKLWHRASAGIHAAGRMVLPTVVWEAGRRLVSVERAPPPEVGWRREAERLAAIPRYTESRVELFGAELRILDAASFLADYEAIFERQVYGFSTDETHPLILDCGANIGLASIFFKRAYPNARVLAFEPDPRICDVLRSNLMAVGLTDVEIVEAAVSTYDGHALFWSEGAHSGRIALPADTGAVLEIACVALRPYLERPVELLKIDIEGEEESVLRHCEDALSNVRRIFVEYHGRQDSPQALHEQLAILNRAGYRYYVHEAMVPRQPFLAREAVLGMDLQLNIFGIRADEL